MTTALLIATMLTRAPRMEMNHRKTQTTMSMKATNVPSDRPRKMPMMHTQRKIILRRQPSPARIMMKMASQRKPLKMMMEAKKELRMLQTTMLVVPILKRTIQANPRQTKMKPSPPVRL